MPFSDFLCRSLDEADDEVACSCTECYCLIRVPWGGVCEECEIGNHGEMNYGGEEDF